MNKQAELTRWTPKRLLSLLMALIMTLSLLPTAALAAADDYKLTITDYPTGLFVGQTSGDIKATLTAKPSAAAKNVRLKITVTQTVPSGSIINPGDCTILYQDATSGTYTAIATTADTATGTITGYLGADSGSSLAPGGTVSATFTLKFNKSGYYSYTVKPFEWDATTGEGNPLDTSHAIGVNVEDSIESLTVDPVDPEAGQPFTVRAGTAFNSGHVAFTYNGDTKSVPVSPLPDNKGYAEYTFIADAATTGPDTISATLFGVAGISDATKTATVNVGTPATYHTVTFHENAAGVYNMPAPQPVVSGGNAVDPAVKPQRDGYTFGGWYKEPTCTTKWNFTTAVTTDLELYAKWTATPVTVNFPAAAALPAGVTIFPVGGSMLSSIGREAHFTVKVPDKYNTTDLLVSAGHFGTTYSMLVPVARVETADGVTLYYQFTVTEDLVDPATSELDVTVSNFIEKTFTVMMPTGHFDAEITAADPIGSTVATDKKSASIVYGGDYTFSVTPDPGYDVAVYVNGVKQTATTGNSYTVTDVTGPQRVEVVESAIPNYTVTFTVPLSGQTFTQSVARGNKATEPRVAPEREGYTFAGWYTDDQYTNGTEFNFDTLITKDTVLYGKLTPKTYNIEYNLNSGTDATNPATITAQTKTHGLAEKLSETVPTRDGYTFLGWGTTADATAPSYQPGDMYSVDGDIELYAVWQQKTYTITFSSGEGYTLHSGHGSMTVADGENFDFNLIVDPAYAQNDPEVWTNTTGVGTGSKLTNPAAYTDPVDGSKQYHYTLMNVKADTAVNVKVTANATYTVTFMTNGTTYQTQQVEYDHKATQPVDPKVEGYTFGGWYKNNTGWTDADKWDFATPITGDTTIYAKLDPITPKITWPTATTGYEFKFTAPAVLVGNTTGTGKVDYGSTVTFTIKILDGYDASKMQVGINGVLLAPKDKSEDGKTYTFEFIAKQDTEAISVTGIERKTVTIIYNDNGGYGGPVQETVNYYLPSGPNGEISKTVPTREGYDFLGWATTNKADAPAYSNPAKTTAPVTTNVADFTSDTVLYAVWQAKETGITLEVSNTIDDTATPKAQYEGENVTLTATITSAGSGASVTTGSVQFYRSTDGGTKWTQLDSKVVSGGTAIYTAETSGFKYGGTNTDTYKAVFIPTEGNGYTEITSDTKAVTVKSTAISWKLDTTDPTTHKIKDKANALTIKNKAGATVDSMVAGQVYTLELPAIYALDEQTNNLTVKQDYSVTWQYCNDKGVWTDYTNSGSGDTTKVDAAYSQYVFRAVVTPVTGATSHFTKAAKYTTDGALVKDQYETVLISEPTTEVDLQKTTTALEITGADDEAANVTINGATDVFTDAHLAQFEGQKVTLTATVKDTTAGTSAVTTGEVNFYRKGATADTLLNASPIAVGTNGVATCEVTISNWDTTQTAANNKDEFYAVYLANATYNTSASWTAAAAGSTATGKLEAVYIKSTAIKTPIIESTLAGKLNGADANSTSYEYDLTGLLAGVEHTFELRVGNDKADWSVVALDGRTVAAENYTIQWITKSGDNAETTAATDSKFKTSDNKVGDEIYVRLNPTGDMKTGADSKKAIIGTKQGVKVTVEAIDAIDKTPTAKDVYQLNEIELRATVTAADAKASMQPDGLVQFYYVDDNNFVEIGKPVSIQTVGGARYASIKTNQLPVTAVDNTKRDVKITAVYLGDTTFKASDNWQLKSGSTTEWEVTAADITDTVKSDTVTVYSSVVYAGEKENQAAQQSNYGITITANGALKANESSVTLTLGQVYTLDHDIPLSKLTYNTDYTVQWQILKNALQHQDSGSAGSYASTTAWEDLQGQTGMNYTGTMEQDAAYRAKITVKDTPIAKGSYDEVPQTISGRKVYYSNVLVVGVGMATVTTNITTSANQNFNEEGIVSGETATIHVLASGAAKTTPISTVTATITKSGATDPVFNEKANNVNGYTSFAWDTSDLTPGYYTLTVTAESNNGYAPQTITRTLIVRDNAYTLTATKESKVYNGKAQGIEWTLTGVDIEDALAQKSVVVYYYDKDGKMVEPTQAGEYQYDLYLPASAYWTELTHVSGTFIIEKRPVEVVDLVAQAKVYDGTNNANIQEIILNDAEVNSTTGLPTDDKGIIDGDSVYAVGTGYTSKDTAGTDATLGVKDVSLKGDDAANYTLSASGYTEVFNIQRSQVKGAIVSGRTYKYTGKDIKLAASDIYLIDQAGNQLTNYDVTYYYHNGDGVEKVDAMNKMGKYTVIARPEQNNYKGGATETVYVGTADNAGTLDKNAVSSLITISNTVELYGATNGVTVSATKGTATASYYYNNGTSADWHTDVPANAGRYLVKATVTNDGVTDTAYGLYTVVKARPALTLTATGATYNSAQYNGAPTGTYNNDPALPADTYFTYTGGTIQGVAYEAPTEAGDYVVTAHVGKAANYTAHEISANFTIAQAALTIKADDLQRWQYGSFPDMVASYQGLATGGIAADTSLRDVQIQPEFLFNEQNGGYTNHAFDQVGTYPVTVRNALARNYTVTYVGGTIATTAEEPKAELAIHGMPDNGTTTENLVYYGDTIQLYAYGYYKTIDSSTSSGSYNTSSLIEWAVSSGAPASIDPNGLLKINGVGTFTVTLTRGSGSAAISTTINVTAKKQEVKVVVPDQDLIYNGAEQKYDGGKFYAENAKGERITATPYMHDGKVKRTNVGSQIITSWVGDTNATYQSEHYCGLFTINVKDVTVKPKTATTTYGTAVTGLTHTESNTVSSVAALTGPMAVSVADAYNNLDVLLDGYEILVAGRENENYNVKYVTDQAAPDVQVTAKDLIISTGTLNEQTGMTSGSLNPMGKYPVNGAAIGDPAPAMGPSNVRMYGEPNWVMDKDPVTLISGDTLADLTALGNKLVSFNYNIGADANVSYTDKSTKLTVSGSPMPDYEVFTDAFKMAFKNYNETYTLGTQNIYQRPVTLSVPSGMTLTAYKPSILDSSNQVKNDVLLNLLLNNLIVSKYNNEGGLAELLKHTIKDLDIRIKSTQVTGDKLTVKIALGNQNYWLNSANEQTFEITLVTEKIVPKYSTLDWTSFSVTMYDAEGKAPVSVNGAVNFYIFKKKDGADLKYSDYKNDPIIRSGPMTPTGSTGQYVASFERLPAGEYAYFAIAQNYTIVE